MFGQIYFRVLGIGCFLSMALLLSAQSKLDSLHHLNEVVVTARINKEVIPVQSLSGDKLEKLAAHSVADAIRYFSGVQIKDYGGIEIDKEGRTVKVDGKVIELSLREYELLVYLVENENISLWIIWKLSLYIMVRKVPFSNRRKILVLQVLFISSREHPFFGRIGLIM